MGEPSEKDGSFSVPAEQPTRHFTDAEVRRNYEYILTSTNLYPPELHSAVRSVLSEPPLNPDWSDKGRQIAALFTPYGDREYQGDLLYPIISKEISDVINGARKGQPYRLARINGELLDKNGKKSIYNCENYKYLLDAPFKISARCCYHMKKAPLNKFERQTGRHPITGVLACESKLREQSWIKFGCNGFERQRPLSQPLAFWLEEDILRYLKMTGIPYAPIYGDIVESRKKDGTPILKTTGVSRSGCMYCMYGVHLEHEPNRFQLMQVTHPQQYDYCINKLGCGAVLDYIGVPYRNQQLEVDHC